MTWKDRMTPRYLKSLAWLMVFPLISCDVTGGVRALFHNTFDGVRPGSWL